MSNRTLGAHDADAPTPRITIFRSGASSPADLAGYVVAGRPCGVSLNEFSPGNATWDNAVAYASRGGKLFVDTGAFTAFTKGIPVDWDRVVGLELLMAHEAGLGSRIHFVAPDVIGDQDASLALLAHYRKYMLALVSAGHDVLVPIQRGHRRPYDAWREAVSVLGTECFTPAIPSNKEAFSLAELADLFDGQEKPRSAHILGVAGNKAKLAEMAGVIHSRNRVCQISSDANRLRAQIGRGRPITQAAPGWLSCLAVGMEGLLDDPVLKRAWRAQAKRALAGVVRALSVASAEGREDRQRDMFG